jgi:hypothetical protein
VRTAVAYGRTDISTIGTVNPGSVSDVDKERQRFSKRVAYILDGSSSQRAGFLGDEISDTIDYRINAALSSAKREADVDIKREADAHREPDPEPEAFADSDIKPDVEPDAIAKAKRSAFACGFEVGVAFGRARIAKPKPRKRFFGIF